MASQDRAEATRQTIIDAAVDLFMEVGYGSTAIKDIIGRAEVTNGAFYYHFPTKESLASTIIEDAESRIQDLVLRITLSSSSPALENLIRSHFAVEASKVLGVRHLVPSELATVRCCGRGPASAVCHHSESRAMQGHE